ncbi:16S rRNA (guanine(966)-N(2))-methyltransferase RsmD [Alteromonas pelagimontana]|uniref:Ribosomal RNA small subunit methyltransferase D n=1 Tax=Alteromonas pelagimontana TaxID=1858656 RepID=A0A6M4ME28_9ALTE|nr:16S rRNA (guanine(966)-N(2))-methyltransferase RsmD [Alteromonas pelagimontana]QJR81444.1 16S rRNA (guanine(966)-N(2))-methyltransferase RsmD [Alteromonas pelagimontana]
MIALSATMKRVSKAPQSSRNTSRRDFASGKKTGTVRIIGGQWRGRKLPVANVEGLRPTTDRNKETVFNWLMHDTQNAICLDVFAGSGGLGLEALSRYAAQCIFIEKDSAAAANLKTNLNTLQANAKVHCGDALTVLSQLEQQFDIVFIDPPFYHNLVMPTLQQLISAKLLKAGSLLYIEQEIDAAALTLSSGWEIVKHKRTSQLEYMVVRCAGLEN